MYGTCHVYRWQGREGLGGKCGHGQLVEVLSRHLPIRPKAWRVVSWETTKTMIKTADLGNWTQIYRIARRECYHYTTHDRSVQLMKLTNCPGFGHFPRWRPLRNFMQIPSKINFSRSFSLEIWRFFRINRRNRSFLTFVRIPRTSTI